MKGISYSDQIKPNNLDIYKKFKISNFKKMKSSLKFCVVAAGEFDIYMQQNQELVSGILLLAMQ